MLKMVLFTVTFLMSIGQGVQAAHPLSGSWIRDALRLEIDMAGKVSTNVGTIPDRYKQVFPGPLYWYSTSETTGYYIAEGYFAMTMEGFRRGVVCRFPLTLSAYIDKKSGMLTARFSNPTGVWLGPDGKCMSQDWQQQYIQFSRVEQASAPR